MPLFVGAVVYLGPPLAALFPQCPCSGGRCDIGGLSGNTFPLKKKEPMQLLGELCELVVPAGGVRIETHKHGAASANINQSSVGS